MNKIPVDKTHWLGQHIFELVKHDKHIAQVQDLVGLPPFLVRPKGFETLLALIIEQQISVKAAASILARAMAAMKKPTPKSYLLLSDDELRGIGLSGQKVRYTRDLAERIESGELNMAKINKLSDGEIHAHLQKVKGIGRWTVENYLIFALERPDIWPAGDLALQEGVKIALKLETRPTIAEMDVIAQRWKPYRTGAALLLWYGKEGPEFLASK